MFDPPPHRHLASVVHISLTSWPGLASWMVLSSPSLVWPVFNNWIPFITPTTWIIYNRTVQHLYITLSVPNLYIFICSQAHCYTYLYFHNCTTLLGTNQHHLYITELFFPAAQRKNVTYFLRILLCGSLYIEETGHKLADCFTEHLRDICLNNITSFVVHHFNSPTHTVSHIEVCDVFFTSWPLVFHYHKELDLIFCLGCYSPLVMNSTVIFI